MQISNSQLITDLIHNAPEVSDTTKNDVFIVIDPEEGPSYYLVANKNDLRDLTLDTEILCYISRDFKKKIRRQGYILYPQFPLIH